MTERGTRVSLYQDNLYTAALERLCFSEGAVDCALEEHYVKCGANVSYATASEDMILQRLVHWECRDAVAAALKRENVIEFAAEGKDSKDGVAHVMRCDGCDVLSRDAIHDCEALEGT